MSEAWKNLDLGGGGLQAANLKLARTLRRKRTAYLLWLLFPLGGHRFYLKDAIGGAAYIVASAALLGAVVLDSKAAAFAISAALVVVAAFDLWRIERRVINVNKRLRMNAYLRQVPGAPPDFTGRLTDAPDAPAPRSASFAEQERLLAEIERVKDHKG